MPANSRAIRDSVHGDKAMTLPAQIFHLPLRYVLMDRRRARKREHTSLHLRLVDNGFARIGLGIKVRRYRCDDSCPDMLWPLADRKMCDWRNRYILHTARVEARKR
jgi:hypothetical protein